MWKEKGRQRYRNKVVRQRMGNKKRGDIEKR